MESFEHLEFLKEEDLIIFDRGYFSYEFCLYLVNKKLNYLFRIREGIMPKPIMDFIASSENERVVYIEPTKNVLYRINNKEDWKILGAVQHRFKQQFSYQY
jgi:hypothetical protein